MIIVLLSILALGFILNLAPVQTFFAQRATNYLSESWNTTVAIEKVRIHFFDKLELEQFVVLDEQNDTLLASGSLQVELNDFFFMQKEIIVKHIQLADANVNLLRSPKSDRWNYQFIVDKMGGSKDSNAGGSTPHIQLEDLNIDRTRFTFKDEWIGTDYIARVQHLQVKGDAIDYDAKKIHVKSIDLVDVSMGIVEYTGGRPPRKRKRRDINEFSKTPFNTAGWEVVVDKIAIENGRFFLEYLETKVPENLFDHNHLDVTKIFTQIKHITIVGDTIKGKLLSLKAQERSGLAIQEFKSDITVSPIISECKNLYLRTNNSVITDYYAMKYRHFPDFLDYIKRVNMVANFKQAKIGINDILYFTDAIERIQNHQFELSGYAFGPVSYLQSKELKLSDGKNTFVGDFAMKNIPYTEQMTMEIHDGLLTANGANMLAYAPELQDNPNLNIPALGDFTLKGSFVGLLNNFDAAVNVNSRLGVVDAKMNIKDALSGLIKYDGTVVSQAFNIGAFFNQTDWGTITMNSTIQGQGITPTDANQLDFDVTIPEVTYNKYSYNNIHFNGIYEDEVFKGNAAVIDSNLHVVIEKGQLFFRNKKAVYNLDANIFHVNTQALNLTNHLLKGNAEVNLNFTGTSLDDFLGSVLVYNMEMNVNDTPIDLNQFYLSATTSQQKRNINFLTNGIDAQMSGDFKLSTLPAALRKYFSQYFPEYLKPENITTPQQDVTFNITTKGTDDFFKLINVPAKLSAGAVVNGYFNSTNNYLSFNGNIPFVSYNGVNFKDGKIKVWGDEDGLKQDITLKDFSYEQYEIASLLHLDANFINNYGDFIIKTESVNTLGNAEIVGNIAGRADSFFMHLEPSTVLFNHKKWTINSPKDIVYSPDYLNLSNVELTSENQKISINTKYANPNNLFIAFENVEANPINNLFHFTDFYLHGKVNGNVHVKDVFKYQDIDYSLSIDTLFIDQIKYGHLYLTGTANLNKSSFAIMPPSALFTDLGAMNLNVVGNYDKKQSSIRGNVKMEKVPLAYIYPFTKNHIEEPEGFLTAHIDLKGDFYQPTYTGLVTLEDIKVKPILTGVTYFIDKEEIKIEESALVFRKMEVRDALYNKGLVNGSIKSDGWDNYLFNLSLSSDRLQVLSLDKYDNSYYYGQITAATTVNLTGRWNNIKMNVVGKPLANSRLIIPIATGGDYGSYEYITFKKHDDSLQTQTVPDFNYHLRIDAIATSDLEAIIILDESTGDKLQAKGSGNLVLDIPSNGEMTLTGNYIIEEGLYNFAFKQLEVLNYKKEFILEPGSAIKWGGNLYDADLAVRANTQVKARLYDLIMNETDRIGLNTQEITDAQLAQFINIHLDMNGALSKPQLTFKLDLVENRSIGTYAYQKLQRINTNERELLNQVSGLLLLNQFLPPEGLNNSSISAGAITNMSELLSSTASSQISNFANKLLGVEDLIINLKYKNYALSGMDPNNPAAYLNRNEAGLNVRKNFFNDRLVTEVGGVYDWGNRNTNYNLAGEFRVQYLLTKDGRIRLNAFRTSNYDAVVQQNIGRQGAGLQFKRSFSNLRELFGIEKKKNANSIVDTILPSPIIIKDTLTDKTTKTEISYEIPNHD